MVPESVQLSVAQNMSSKGGYQELKEHIKEDGGVAEALELIELRMEEMKLTAMDVLPVLWKSVMDSAERSTKSSTQQQTHQAVLRLLRTWMKIYQTHCQTSKQELLLMNVVQVSARACSNERPSVRFRSIDRCMMHASFRSACSVNSCTCSTKPAKALGAKGAWR